MKCPYCNADNPDGAKFCGVCGRPLSGDNYDEQATTLLTENDALRMEQTRKQGSLYNDPNENTSGSFESTPGKPMEGRYDSYDWNRQNNGQSGAYNVNTSGNSYSSDNAGAAGYNQFVSQPKFMSNNRQAAGDFSNNGQNSMYSNPVNTGYAGDSDKDKKSGNQYYSEQYKPISMWGYLGYELLFAIPLAGFIIVIVMSFAGKNQNVKNFARSYLLLILIALVIAIVIMLVVGTSGLSALLSSSMQQAALAG